MDNKPSYEELEKRIKYLEQKILKEKDKQSKKRKLAINIGKRGIYLITGKGLKNAFKNIIEDYQKNKSISSENLSNLFTHLVWRFTRIGIFTVFVAALPSIFLIIQSCLLTSQNKKIDKQNELIEKQNKFIDSQTKRLDQQTYLQESSRRSSSMFLFSNIMNKIDEELKIKENLKRHLSNELIASIISLSHSLKPYKYLKNDKLSEYISPERGQLLTFLINARLSSENYSNILKEGDFTFSEIKNIEFKNINLNEVNLEGSSIENVKFIDCSILNLNLFNTKVEDLNFEHCNIIEFRSKYSNQKNIKLLNSNISVLSYDNCFVNSFILKNSFIKNFKSLETNILDCIFKKNVFNYFIYERSKYNIDYFKKNLIRKGHNNLRDFNNTYFLDQKLVIDLSSNIIQYLELPFNDYLDNVQFKNIKYVFYCPNDILNPKFTLIKTDSWHYDKFGRIYVKNLNYDEAYLFEDFKKMKDVHYFYEHSRPHRILYDGSIIGKFKVSIDYGMNFFGFKK